MLSIWKAQVTRKVEAPHLTVVYIMKLVQAFPAGLQEQSKGSLHGDEPYLEEDLILAFRHCARLREVSTNWEM